MPFGDEDIAVGSYDHIGRLIEKAGRITGHSGFTKRHEDLSIRAELENLLALSIAALFVGHPEVSILVDRRAVRKVEHSLAPGSSKACPIYRI